MADLNFRSSREEKRFKAYKAGVETVLDCSIEDLYKSEIGRTNELILFCVRCSSDTTKENVKMTAQIVKKFLDATKEVREEKHKGNNCLFSAKVFMLLKSLLRPPKKTSQGKKRTFQLTEEELDFLHGKKGR